MLGDNHGLEWERHCEVHPKTRALLERMFARDPKARADSAEELR
jgi:hypothetical protein